MRALEDRLKAQNTGTVWIDCEQRGLKHRLTPEPVPGYSRCLRCPVVIRHGRDLEQERRWAALDASVPCSHVIQGTCDYC